LPFAAWAWRNWRAFHVFQPLAPQTASDPGEPSYPGWERWVKTWSLDFSTTYRVYWHVPNEDFDLDALPARAFDSAAERKELKSIAEAYGENDDEISPALDVRLERLAQQRIRHNPLRYYVWLPLGRLMDMTFHPRTDNMNIDVDWWAYSRHPDETVFSWAYAGLNALYLV